MSSQTQNTNRKRQLWEGAADFFEGSATTELKVDLKTLHAKIEQSTLEKISENALDKVGLPSAKR